MKDKKAKRILIFIFLLMSILFGVFYYIYKEVSGFDSVIYPGVFIEGIDLTAKTKNEAKNIIESKYSKVIVKKNITISWNDKKYNLSYAKLNPRYNIQETIDNAYGYGKNLSILSKYKIIKSKSIQNYLLKFSYDKKAMDGFIDSIEKDINKEAENAKINVNKGSISIVQDKKGFKLEKDRLKKILYSKMDGKNLNNINEKAPVKTQEAKIKKKQLETVNSNISSYTTNYGSISSPQRANNIVISTKAINGTLLMPGESFSFNNTVGPRTEKRGYQGAPVIIGNKIESGLGGGICQVSGTLYNAMLKANINATERVRHTFPSTYVPIGMDATIDYGNIDYKFKNILTYPIYIEGITNGANVTFNIYSNSSLKNKTYNISSEIYETITPKEQYIDDTNIPLGKTEIVQEAHTGYKVKVYKSTVENDSVVKKELLYTDFYKPVDKIIKRGTKK
ncbi:vancomycin B-type resistance protein VanW [Clostridium sporogenes]|uniref:VanW family protein n=1 Tax=Clostridium botulinum TaxID=1491 RepID=UPI000717638D|nr:VanW family protein [Clostridium botulinum]KRU24990.1 vancomycin B-type resistance protein VanW [Clostridium sporogenes]KRU31883.1 vancomycin B-type resistance protein VanW [Clostridium sporogenes]KRU34151.1 vancomycin B-type resistance protein VanW [Clostridium sporogenes]KRU41168.1 vancomycin B-type resistance protein VanW [Clostridium sporogenes]MBZ1328244.1 VanW family protein [Clostridium botulinum]